MIEERKEEGNGSSNNTKVVGDSASVKKTLTSTLNESDDNILFTNNRMTDKVTLWNTVVVDRISHYL